MIHILIADDHNVFVEGIASLLAGVPNLQIAGRCFNTDQVRKIIQSQTVDVILLDISFPKMEDGMALCNEISTKYTQTKIIALTMHDEQSVVKRMIRKGAHGYLFKNTSKTELIDAIHTVYNGESFTNPAIRSLLGDGNKPKKRAYHVSNEIILTPRETEVLFLISEGLTTQQIANKLFVTLKAVEFHRSSLLAKFDVPNTALLIKSALEEKHI